MDKIDKTKEIKSAQTLNDDDLSVVSGGRTIEADGMTLEVPDVCPLCEDKDYVNDQIYHQVFFRSDGTFQSVWCKKLNVHKFF